jgi:hypothetical protein
MFGLTQTLRTWAFDQYRPLLIILRSRELESAVGVGESYDEYIVKPGDPIHLRLVIARFLGIHVGE